MSRSAPPPSVSPSTSSSAADEVARLVERGETGIDGDPLAPQQQDARINAVDGDHGRPAAARDGLPVYGVFGVLYATSFCSGFQTVS